VSQKIQSPDISQQLRRELSLAAAGAFGMEMDELVVPVALVADITGTRRELYNAFSGQVGIAAVAAQYARALVSWTRTTTPLNRVEVRRVTVSSSTAQAIRIGWGAPQPAGVIARGPKVQIPVGITAPSMVDVTSDNSAVAPVASEYAWTSYIGVTAPLVLDFSDDPWVMLTPGIGAAPGLVIHGGTVNTDLLVSCEWREYAAR
jgi:hypothetical protein